MSEVTQVPDINMNGAMVIARTREAVYVRLPREIQRPLGWGSCSCGFCDGVGLMDALVVPLKVERGANDYCYTVHMPDRSVSGFLAYMARKERAEVPKGMNPPTIDPSYVRVQDRPKDAGTADQPPNDENWEPSDSDVPF